uniref:Sm domain-containing protein n=1 Tax=Panagrolaimus sp. JU765 TaxID=591449 RepID=A0AC34QU01_9BILA
MAEDDSEELFDLLDAPAPESPVKKRSPKKQDIHPRQPEIKGNENAESSETQQKRRWFEGPLDVEHRQELLGRVGLPEGPRKIQSRVRIKTMAAICVDGASPLTTLPKLVLTDPIGFRISKLIKDQSLVQIKLRNRSHFEPPNRTIIGIILAADQHWNLLITDADEAYMPAVKVGVVQSYPDQMFEDTAYERVPGHKRLLQRSLQSTIIMGKNIVHISILPQTQ